MTAVLDFTKPHVLRNEEEYDAAIGEIHELLELDPIEGTEEYDRLKFLSVLVEAYEDENIPEPSGGGTPQSIVDFMLEQKGMKRSDLVEIMGGGSRVSDFFNDKRSLSKAQIQGLRDLLGIPADLLI
jgi:HTH-type transcriptional regulator / antitoxin HigA